MQTQEREQKAKRGVHWADLTWEEAIARVETMEDRLGSTVDEGIMDTVAIFNILGFRTSQSCEGHLDHGLPWPWIDLMEINLILSIKETLETMVALRKDAIQQETWDALARFTQAEQRWNREEGQARHIVQYPTKMNALLTQFYAETGMEADAPYLRYHLKPEKQDWTAYRFQPVAASLSDKFPKVLAPECLERTQAQIRAFTTFLQRHWETTKKDTLTR